MAAFFGANEIWKSYDGEGREPVVLAGVRETDVKVQYRPLCWRRKGR